VCVCAVCLLTRNTPQVNADVSVQFRFDAFQIRAMLLLLLLLSLIYDDPCIPSTFVVFVCPDTGTPATDCEKQCGHCSCFPCDPCRMEPAFRAWIPLVGPFESQAKCEVRVLPVAKRGLHLWWSLKDIHSLLRGADHQTFGVFRSRRWPRWLSFIEEADIGGDDGLLLGRISHSQPIVEGETDTARRCEFAFPCADTRCMLLLLVRWCSKTQQTGRIEYLVEPAMIFLQAMLSKFNGNLRVVADGHVETTDTSVSGSRMIVFAVRDGMVDLRVARRAFNNELLNHCPSLEPEASECSLLDLLLSAPCVQFGMDTDFGYLSQLAWILGPMIEHASLQVTPNTADDRPWWKRASLTYHHVASSYDRVCFAYSYSQASAVRAKQTDVASIAVDDSRVGRQPWKLGVYLDPSTNHAFWLLPQAQGSLQTKPKQTEATLNNLLLK
jgi:hypothetical protein